MDGVRFAHPAEIGGRVAKAARFPRIASFVALGTMENFATFGDAEVPLRR